MNRSEPNPSRKLLVCLDGSLASIEGLRYAVAIAGANGSEILLQRVLERSVGSHPRPVDAVGAEVARVEATQYLQRVKAELKQRGYTAQTRLVEGSPAEQIIRVADKEQVSLIVLATHGSRGATQFRLGGTAQKVVQHAHQSILLARSSGDSVVNAECTLKRILVLLDGSQSAEASLVSAQTLAKEQGAELVLGHVATCPDLPSNEPLIRRDQDLLQRLEERNLELVRRFLRTLEQALSGEGLATRSVVVRNADTRQGVLDLVQEVRADLMVLASHGQTSSRHANHGSLTQHLLSYSPVPLWVVQNLHRHADGTEPQEALRIHAHSAK